MKTVFVTGASSVLGKKILEQLAPGCRILAATHRREINSPGAQVEALPNAFERCAEFSAQIQGADVVLHLAAVTHSSDEQEYFRVNAEMTERLLEVCRPGQRFVFVSSLSAHPEGGAYSRSKWLAEEALKNSALDYIIVRPSDLYGSKSGEGIDALITFARKTRLLPDFRIDGRSMSYTPIGVEEAAEFIANVVVNPKRSRASYTLCAARAFTARDMATALRKTAGRVFVIPVPLKLLRALSALPIPLPFERDQIQRLTAPRDTDVSGAQKDYGFQSKGLLDVLAA